jgi:hypothetical protein
MHTDAHAHAHAHRARESSGCGPAAFHCLPPCACEDQCAWPARASVLRQRCPRDACGTPGSAAGRATGRHRWAFAGRGARSSCSSTRRAHDPCRPARRWSRGQPCAALRFPPAHARSRCARAVCSGPHLHRDSAHPFRHICAGTGHTPLPHLHRDRARPSGRPFRCCRDCGAWFAWMLPQWSTCCTRPPPPRDEQPAKPPQRGPTPARLRRRRARLLARSRTARMRAAAAAGTALPMRTRPTRATVWRRAGECAAVLACARHAWVRGYPALPAPRNVAGLRACVCRCWRRGEGVW